MVPESSHTENQPPSGRLGDVNSLSVGYLEALFESYKTDPLSLAPEWRRQLTKYVERNGRNGAPAAYARSPYTTPAASGYGHADADDVAALQERLDDLVRNYRVRGHVIADVDPLGRAKPVLPELDPAYYGFTDAHYDTVFSTRNWPGPQERTLGEVLSWLQNTYCRSIGAQFMHIDDLSVREWLQDRMESTENRLNLAHDVKLRILRRLTDAVLFERFVQTKFAGAKSFSLEGGESLIPLLDLAIEKAGNEGVQEIVIGMAHRGRLNVLANVIGKRPREIFREFMDAESDNRTGPGDVKYHLGYSSDWQTSAGRSVHLSLAFNPSHLEYVNTVAMGRVRAKQDRVGDADRRRGMLVLIHGDAAFAGEGVVQEALNLSQLPGYRIGGTLHIIVNNQIGFTTTPGESRSSIYATDVAKLLQSPIFHVNGEDPEAVAQVVQLALDFRATYQRDVVIDMYCYRLRGHNEGDEPTFTQPQMYQAVAKRPGVREGYLSHLLTDGGVTRNEADRIEAQSRERLNEEFRKAQAKDYVLGNATPTGMWAPYVAAATDSSPVNTGVPRETLSDLLHRLSTAPEGFSVHPKLVRWLERRRRMAEGAEPLDWATAEALAMASLASEGYRVRLSGQDCQRGTFSQRHAVLHDVENGQVYMPLAHVAPNQAPVEIINSPLSEAGVMGFDYGYSLDWPDGLIMWEAQFGDFVNAAQVIIDQFLASAELKWRRLSGLTLLLPHGFEGQGPEHSSARMERMLNLAAQDNLRIVCASTPAQYFHCLRRQVVMPQRKPLIVFTPKALLRRPDCTSTLGELARGAFRPVRPEPWVDETARSILLCTGKVYYDLLQRRDELGRHDTPIIRIEQLHPLPVEELRAALAPYVGCPATWVQEEPENMGAWRYVRHMWESVAGKETPLNYVGRPASASPASGSHTAHEREQHALVNEAFNTSILCETS
jgi:2-oxoglutarate dehydrogenase E1 component